VDVNDVGFDLASRGSYLRLRGTAPQERNRGTWARHTRRTSPEDGVRDVRLAQGGRLELDGAFLSALGAVAVVDQ
jgi:hypothetical protein